MAQIKPEVFNELLGITESYQAPQALLEVLYDRPRREQLMMDVLTAVDFDVDDDFFRDYFQAEHADRKVKKQDFTPTSISRLTRALVGDTGGSFYEGCAGTGSMTIAAWDADRKQHSPFDYRPSWYFYVCEELSERAIPFLVFNLAIRGMNAVVTHCDVLSREAYDVFYIQNDKDDHLSFSSINVLDRSEAVANAGLYIPLKWSDKITYDPQIESPREFEELPAFSAPPRGSISEFTFAVYAMCGVKHPELDDYLAVKQAEMEAE